MRWYSRDLSEVRVGPKILFLASRFLSSDRPRASLNRLLTEVALLSKVLSQLWPGPYDPQDPYCDQKGPHMAQIRVHESSLTRRMTESRTYSNPKKNDQTQNEVKIQIRYPLAPSDCLEPHGPWYFGLTGNRRFLFSIILFYQPVLW